MSKRKVHLDQYFTSQALVERCVREFEKSFSFGEFDLVIEPSAGSGRFLRALPPAKTVAMDISPKDPNVKFGDFLLYWPPEDGKILVIGNPPFGQRGALAVRFINHAMRFAHTVAMILPRSFNKYTFMNRVDQNFVLIDSTNLEGVFDFEGDEVSVQTVFQVWQRSSKQRELIRPQHTHSDFLMRHAHLSRTTETERKKLDEFADFAIPQVGARFRPVDPSSLVKGSHWFIKLNDGAVREAFERLDFSFLSGQNTAHTSLSKSDIVRAYIEACTRLGSPRDSAESSEAQLHLFE